MIEAITAPSSEPTPPTMMTMNAVTITEWPICGLTDTKGAVRAPATPAWEAPMNMAMRAVWWIEMPWSAAASASWADARSAQPKRGATEKVPKGAEQDDGGRYYHQARDRQAHPIRKGDHLLGYRRNMLHAHAEAEHRECLQNHQKTDRGDQAAKRVFS